MTAAKPVTDLPTLAIVGGRPIPLTVSLTFSKPAAAADTDQLAMVLIAVISQQLIPTLTEAQLMLEIMSLNNAIRNMIRVQKSTQIDGIIANFPGGRHGIHGQQPGSGFTGRRHIP